MIFIEYYLPKPNYRTTNKPRQQLVLLILIENIMEDIVKNPGLQHIIEKSLKLLSIKDIVSVKSVNQDFRKIVDCPRFYLTKLSQQENVPKALIQK